MVHLLSYLLDSSFLFYFLQISKNETKKYKMVQHLFINSLYYVKLCNTVDIHQSSTGRVKKFEIMRVTGKRNIQSFVFINSKRS